MIQASFETKQVEIPTSTLTFGFGQQTIPTNWHQGYDYSWYTANPSGHGIEPNDKKEQP